MNMKVKANSMKKRKSVARVQQKPAEVRAKLGSLEWREEETAKLLAVAKRQLPDLKVLLASVSDHWGYEDPIYRFYHHSFKVLRAQTATLKMVETLQSLAPHLKLNPDFLKIVAEGTARPPASERAIIEAFFHAHHMLFMLCKYAKELPEPPPTLPSGWATVLYLYDIR
jgi:hypothetical protein